MLPSILIKICEILIHEKARECINAKEFVFCQITEEQGFQPDRETTHTCDMNTFIYFLIF